MKHFIYRTTNLLNGKFYVGRHSTTNMNDGYFGSGIVLKKAIEKYNVSNEELKNKYEIVIEEL